MSNVVYFYRLVRGGAHRQVWFGVYFDWLARSVRHFTAIRRIFSSTDGGGGRRRGKNGAFKRCFLLFLRFSACNTL